MEKQTVGLTHKGISIEGIILGILGLVAIGIIAIAVRIPRAVDAHESFVIFTQFIKQSEAINSGFPPKAYSPRRGATIIVFDSTTNANVLQANELIKARLTSLYSNRIIKIEYSKK